MKYFNLLYEAMFSATFDPCMGKGMTSRNFNLLYEAMFSATELKQVDENRDLTISIFFMKLCSLLQWIQKVGGQIWGSFQSSL